MKHPAKQLPKLNILMIEDCPHDAELALNNLKLFTVTVVNTLTAGLDTLKKGKFDLVFLDLKLTNGTKEESFGKVKKVRGDAATVILTGDTNPATRDLLLNLGADGFMRKGIDDKGPIEMNYVIAVALEHRKGKK